MIISALNCVKGDTIMRTKKGHFKTLPSLANVIARAQFIPVHDHAGDFKVLYHGKYVGYWEQSSNKPTLLTEYRPLVALIAQAHLGQQVAYMERNGVLKRAS